MTFLGFKILDLNIFWGFQKNEFIGGIKFYGFWGSRKNWTILRGHFYAFYGLFLRSRYRMGDLLGVVKISNTFLWCLKLRIFFFWGGGGGGEW